MNNLERRLLIFIAAIFLLGHLALYGVHTLMEIKSHNLDVIRVMVTCVKDFSGDAVTTCGKVTRGQFFLFRPPSP